MAPRTETTQFNPQEFVNRLLSSVTSKERDVLERRFGLDKKILQKGSRYQRKMKETLEEIGKSHNITRERVRQIEATAIKKLQEVLASDVHMQDVSTAMQAIKELLQKYGEVMAEHHLLDAYFQEKPLDVKSQEELIVQKQSLLFVISQLLKDQFEKIATDDQLLDVWKVKGKDNDTLLRATIKEFEQIITKKGQPQSFQELVDTFKQTNLYQKHQDTMTEAYLKASLEAAKQIKENKFNEWGLANWRSITPKKTNDKIFLVLKKHGRPMHFTQIAQKINEIGFDRKSAYPATVHNELILDKNYVLVGRGIYALKEWGYTPGVVSDVIAQVLKEEGRSMDKDEIVEKVMSQRMVKKSTIYLALMNKSKFKKVEKNKYTLVEG